MPYDAEVHRTPDDLFQDAEVAEERGAEATITGAGGGGTPAGRAGRNQRLPERASACRSPWMGIRILPGIDCGRKRFAPSRVPTQRNSY